MQNRLAKSCQETMLHRLNCEKLGMPALFWDGLMWHSVKIEAGFAVGSRLDW